MTATTGVETTAAGPSSPRELQRLMRTDYAVSDQQWAAISAPLEPGLVVAGAGSGKTSLMAARVVQLVASRLVEPGQVLGLTFTTKAAAELRARIRSALDVAGFLDDPDVLEPTVATYNSYAAGLLTEHGLRIGHEPDTRVLADASRYQLAARVVARHTGPIELLSDHPETVIQYVLALDSAMSEHLVTPDQVREFDQAERRGFVAAIAAEEAGANRSTYVRASAQAVSAIDRRGELLDLVAGYREAKRRHGVMDFSDQIALSARLAAEQSDVSAFERDKFRVVLLDEYQDTSVAQAMLLRRLFSGPDADHGRGHPVTAVGDPNQAIYGWRGASVSNIVHFGEDFPRADGSADVATHPLTVNRRSDRRILEVANALAAPLYAATRGVRPLESKTQADLGVVSAVVHEHAAAELAWLASEVVRVHDAMPAPAWSEIGVLVRDNAHAAEVFDELSRADIPVEIVGLNGLLRLPEVAEVVATLRLLHDVTANDALLTLLTGPRWAVGPRDLALLGRRAVELSGSRRGRGRAVDVVEELDRAVSGNDPAELAALCDALGDPGDGGYSVDARERFALLAAELRHLRAHAGEPLLDLVRRIIDACGIDVELAAAISPAAAARRDNLDLFVKAVAEFSAVDGEVTLPALIAYLTAEDELGTGLDIGTPTEADSVKLLTVHRAKGLEWDVVFVVGAGESRFPTKTARPLWTSSPSMLPNPLRGDARDLAELSGYDKVALDRFRADSRDVDQREELRLGYVAFTRARHHLVVSSYLWGSRATPFGPSAYQQTVRDCMARWGEQPGTWFDKPPAKTPNPYADAGQVAPWPVTARTHEAELRARAAAVVCEAIEGIEQKSEEPEELDMVEASFVAQWDADIERLLAEATAEQTVGVELPMPSSLSATSLARLRDDPDAFVAELVRPMPRRPSPAARFGTRFHAWVEARFGQQQVIDPDDLPGRADAGIEDEHDLEQLISSFGAGPFGERVPHAVEAPFALVIAGQVVRGRIDAVYAEQGGRWLVVDWKTNRDQTADPLQLAIYRLAWADLAGVPVEQVDAAFHYVRTGQTVRPTGLASREQIASILA